METGAGRITYVEAHRQNSCGKCRDTRPSRTVIAATCVLTAVLALLLLALGTPGAVASADSCPNERLRHESNIDPVSREAYAAQLPDCRAYELVTPPFKFGLYTKGQGEFLDGSHLKTSSLGAFAESSANYGVSGSNYILGRDETSGWSAMPTDLPSSQFYGAGGGLSSPPEEIVDVSRDFSRALVAADPIGSTPGSIESKPINLRFYIRQPPASEGSCAAGAIPVGGACTVEVGPAVPPATVATWTESAFGGSSPPKISYRGASQDLRHVLFSSQAPNEGETNWLWPGDTAIAFESLYEFSGTGSSPRLVGVTNGAGSKVISQCGIDLGSSESRNTHDAIAAQGSTLFFTAHPGGCKNGGHVGTGPKVAELFARIGGSATVAISEPSLSIPGRECTGACREDENEENGHERSEGIFVGASEDGSKVFFLTRQPLVNGDEEGTGTGQDLYEAELEGGAIKRLMQVSHDPNAGEAAEVQGVLRVSDEATRVYFVANGVLATNEDAKGERAVAGADNLYGYEPDPASPGQFKTAFIATLSSSDEFDWGAGRGGGGSGAVEVTPKTSTTTDGRFLLLASRGDLTPDAKGGEGNRELYRFDAQEQKLIRVSIGEGVNVDEEEENEFLIEPPSFASESWAGPQGVAISDDGSYVFFESTTGLTPRALNKQVVGCAGEFGGRCYEDVFAKNVYEYHEGHLYLISDGQDRHEAGVGTPAVRLIGASASGADVYFTTADPLVPQDTDTQQDVYDARTGGGFPAPASPAPCQPAECQGKLSPAPSFQSPGSLVFSGPGNLPAPAVEPAIKAHMTKPLTRAQKLANARKACRKRPKKQRAACVKQARRRYAAKANVRHSNGRSK
jgi:hypothetical protein